MRVEPERHEDIRSTFKNMAHGCQHVFLDVGSNRGVQVRKLFEPQHYPNATILPFFDEYFGTASFRQQPFEKTGLCAFGFEANPLLKDRLKEIQHAYEKKGWRVMFIVPQAVSDSDGKEVTFHLDSKQNTSGFLRKSFFNHVNLSFHSV